jgi:nucleoporin NUP159
VFGTAQTSSASIVAVSAPRTVHHGDDDEDDKDKVMKSRFDEDVIANQDPQGVVASGTVSVSVGHLAPVDVSVRDEDRKGPSSPPLSGLTLGNEEGSRPTSPFLSVEPSPTSSPPIYTPPELLRPHEAPTPTTEEGPHAAEPAGPELEESPLKVEEEESTTPEGSPVKSSLPLRPASVPPTNKPTPTAPTPSTSTGSLFSRLSPSASPPPPTLGLGRPSSVPSRFGVGSASPFVPARSSPLAASPPISRKDVSDSPSPPKPDRASGGIFSKKSSPEPDDEEELNDLLKKVQGSPVKGKAKVLPLQDSAGGTISAPVPQHPSLKPVLTLTPSPSAIPLPLSDEPKSIPRPKTPPLLTSFGFGGTKKPIGNLNNTGTPSPSGVQEDRTAANDLSVSGSTTAKTPLSDVAGLSFPREGSSNLAPSVFASPQPQSLALATPSPSSVDAHSPVLFGGFPKPHPSTSVPSAPAKEQTRAMGKPGPPTQPAMASAKETRLAEDSKPGINNEVNRIMTIMERELDQVRLCISLFCP